MSGSSIPAENHAYRSPTSSPASHAASPVIILKVRQILRSPPCCAQLSIKNQSGCAPALRDLDGYHFPASSTHGCMHDPLHDADGLDGGRTAIECGLGCVIRFLTTAGMLGARTWYSAQLLRPCQPSPAPPCSFVEGARRIGITAQSRHCCPMNGRAPWPLTPNFSATSCPPTSPGSSAARTNAPSSPRCSTSRAWSQSAGSVAQARPDWPSRWPGASALTGAQIGSAGC